MSPSIFEPQYELLNYYFNSIDKALIVFDISGNLKYINKSFHSLISCDNPEDFLGLNLFTDFQLNHHQTDSIKSETYTEIDFNFNKYQFNQDNNLLQTYFDQPNTRHSFMTHMTIRNLDSLYYLVSMTEDTSIHSGNQHTFLFDEQLNLALRIANIAMMDWNTIDKTLHFSENFFQWFDIDIHYILNDSDQLLQLIHPDDVEVLQKEMRFIQNTENREFYQEFRIRQNEIDYLWVRISGYFILDSNNQPIRFSGIMNNITSQKQNSLELESERNNMNNLFNNMNTGFALHRIITDEENKPINYDFIYTNPAYECLTGIPNHSVIGKTILDVMPDVELSLIENYGKVAIEGGTAHFTQYVKSLKRYFDIIAYQTEPMYFAVIFSDVSEKIRSEQALAQTDKMSSIGQLAGGIAHDFNNHLQIIRGYSEIIEEKLGDFNANELSDYVQKILLSVKHSSNMIKQLLAFSKDDHYIGKPMDFHLMLHQTKNILSNTLNKNIIIQLFLDADNFQLLGDDSLLQNTIINMCLNSRDAMPNGGTITISTRNIIYSKDTIIGITKLKAGSYIKCSVRDNGQGIDPEDLSYVFEPFFTTKSNKGTGMGLAAVFGTIKHHQGAIEVNSIPGEWTNFDIYLPNSEEKVEYTYHRSTKEATTRNNYNILLVDDEPVITLVMEQYLSDQGHITTSYNRPNSVLEDYQNKEFDFDLVLLDVIMPEMSGFELLEKLVKLKPDIKVIFLSGYYNTNSISENIKKNILDYIEKPVNLIELNNKIQRLMNETKKVMI